MDYVTKWWAACPQCSYQAEPFNDRKVIEAEIVLHKIATGHRVFLLGEVTKVPNKEVGKCGRVAIGKLV